MSDTLIKCFGIQVAWLDEQFVRLDAWLTWLDALVPCLDTRLLWLDVLLFWLASLLDWLNVVAAVAAGIPIVVHFTSVFYNS